MDRAAPEPDQDQEQSQLHEEAEERASPSGKVVYTAILKEAEDELERSSSALFYSGLAAGLSMGFSLIAEGILRAHLSDTSFRPLISKFGYSVGFLVVILGRQQLFTENTLTPVLPVLQRKDLATLLNMLRLWGVVLAANLLGALVMSLVIARTNLLEDTVRQSVLAIARESIDHSFATVLLRGIVAGWLIALIIWLMPFAEVGRIWVILIITYVVGIGGFSHIIAGAVDGFAAAWAGLRSWPEVLGLFIVPALIGNTIGGVTLVAVLNHAQVVAGGGGSDV